MFLVFLMALMSATPLRSLGADDAPVADPYAKLKYYYPVPKADPPQTIDVDVSPTAARPAGSPPRSRRRGWARPPCSLEFGRHVGGLTASGLSATDGGAPRAASPRRTSTPPSARAASSPRRPGAVQRRCSRPRAFASSTSTGSPPSPRTGRTSPRSRWRTATSSRAKMFIDATYEGDLMAEAGVSLPRRPRGERAVRRDAQRRQFARRQAPVHRSRRSVRRRRATRRAACCPASTPAIARQAGEGDSRVQAYNFRMCLTDVAGEPHPVPQAARTTTRTGTSCCCATSRPASWDAARLPTHADAQPQDRHQQQRRPSRPTTSA